MLNNTGYSVQGGHIYQNSVLRGIERQERDAANRDPEAINRSCSSLCSVITSNYLTPKKQALVGVSLVAAGTLISYFATDQYLLTSQERMDRDGLPWYGVLGQAGAVFAIVNGIVTLVAAGVRATCCRSQENQGGDNIRAVEEGSNERTPVVVTSAKTNTNGSSNGSYQGDGQQPGTSSTQIAVVGLGTDNAQHV